MHYVEVGVLSLLIHLIINFNILFKKVPVCEFCLEQEKIKAKKVIRLGKNPARTQQNKTMQIFTWVMLAMIIFMGFSLASGMGVYWLIGAIFSIGQTLITQTVMDHKKKEK